MGCVEVVMAGVHDGSVLAHDSRNDAPNSTQAVTTTAASARIERSMDLGPHQTPARRSFQVALGTRSQIRIDHRIQFSQMQ